MTKVIHLSTKDAGQEFSLQKSKISFWANSGMDQYFERFDFTDEWNNLGYGRITNDGSKFSISDYSLKVGDFEKVLATFNLDNGMEGVFLGIKNDELFINRQEGLIDSVNYSVIENFIQKTTPVLLDIPFGFTSGVTMRIDCDEAITSGNELAQLYSDSQVPFSMAITTKNDLNSEAAKLMNEVINQGGSIVTHSETHLSNWGGSRESAFREANSSRNKLKAILPKNYNFDFVVSPFHQNPKYAVEGLKDAGIKGFVGGIIKNDPEYIVSRASWAKNVPGIMTHSQQCMLHGDCYHNAGNSLKIYKKSFENHYRTNTFFGYLDHPFSNYKYGWNDEEERLRVHEEFILYMKSFDKVWFASLVDAMSFLWVKVNAKVWAEGDELKWELPEHNYKNLPDLTVLWKGEKIRIPMYGSCLKS